MRDQRSPDAALAASVGGHPSAQRSPDAQSRPRHARTQNRTGVRAAQNWSFLRLAEDYLTSEQTKAARPRCDVLTTYHRLPNGVDSGTRHSFSQRFWLVRF